MNVSNKKYIKDIKNRDVVQLSRFKRTQCTHNIRNAFACQKQTYTSRRTVLYTIVCRAESVLDTTPVVHQHIYPSCFSSRASVPLGGREKNWSLKPRRDTVALDGRLFLFLSRDFYRFISGQRMNHGAGLTAGVSFPYNHFRFKLLRFMPYNCMPNPRIFRLVDNRYTKTVLSRRPRSPVRLVTRSSLEERLHLSQKVLTILFLYH